MAYHQLAVVTVFVLLSGFGLFVLSLVTHLLVWRIGSIKREVLWLFVLFFGLPLVPLLWLYGIAHVSGLEMLAIELLEVALASAYVQTYPVLRHVIPSFRILLLISTQGQAGLTKEEIMQALAHESLFSGGLDDLENDSLVTKVGDRYQVTRSGVVLARIFRLYRRALGAEQGLG